MDGVTSIEVYGYASTPATVPVTGVTLAPTTATLTVGGEAATLTATVLPETATDKTVKWSIFGSAVTLYSDANCTAGNEVGADATDVLTVYAKGVSASSAIVSVTSNADDNISASCIVTVNAASSTPSTVAWTNGNVTATLDGTKLTVEKTAGAADGTMGTSWTKVGSAPTWSTIKETITEVEIKDGVTSIGANAFNRCSNLTSVTFPSGLTSIGDAVFANCSALTSVTFPSSLNSIGQRAFHVCTVLASVTFTPGQEGGGLTIGDSAFDDIPSTTKVTYGTGNTVLYDDTTEITTDTLLTAIQRKTLTWKAKPAPATVAVTGVTLDKTTAEIEVGKTETLTATVAPDDATDKTVTWTSSDEGVATVANGVVTAVAAGTATITAKAGDKTATCEVTVTASSGGNSGGNSGGYTPYIPSYFPSNTTTATATTTTTTTASDELWIKGEEEADTHATDLTWSTVSGATAYSLYIKEGSKYVYVQELSGTAADVVEGANGKYYVSTGGDYTVYKYDKETKSFVKTGTLAADKIDTVKKANNVTNDFMVKYKTNGTWSSETKSLKTSVTVYYKPAVTAAAKKNAAKLSWKEVDGATKYGIFKYTNGKLKKVAEINGTKVKLTGLTSGKTYTYAVRAYVDGKWTGVLKSDLVSVKVK